MMVFAFAAISDRFHTRVLARAEALLADLDGGRLDSAARLEATADLLCEFLPLSEARRDEAVVWMEFENAARTDPRLAETSQRAAVQTTRLIEVVLESVRAQRVDASRFDLALETVRLAALLDGLTVRSVLHPDLTDAEVMRRAVVAHLQGLRRLVGNANIA